LWIRGPRFAEFKPDGSELWVSSEVGGTVSIIDPVKREVSKKIAFDIPGLRKEAIQRVGINITKDGKTRVRGTRARPTAWPWVNGANA
jgi:hypothetical protein